MSGNTDSCNLADPIIYHELRRLQYDISHHAYMMALAAFQRGLGVTFHYSMADNARFSHLPSHGYRGEFFSISDGKQNIHFRRTMAETVSREISRQCENKQLTKQILNQANILVPPGLQINTGKEPEIQRLLDHYPDQHFILKPVTGSLGYGVIRKIPANRVLNTIESAMSQSHLLEVEITGREYRVVVVGKKIAAIYERTLAHVVGNGVSSITELVDTTNKARQKNLLYKDYPIDFDHTTTIFLEKQGYNSDSVPADGVVVYLNDERSHRKGGLIRQASLTPAMEKVTLAAAETMRIQVCGIDFIVMNQGTDDEKIVILEVNQCPHLTSIFGRLDENESSILNKEAEAIIDHYFPDSRSNRRHNKASFDFFSIIELLNSGCIATVSLPVIKSDWQHQRIPLRMNNSASSNIDSIIKETRSKGIYARFIKFLNGTLWLDILGSQAVTESLIEKISQPGATLLSE